MPRLRDESKDPADPRKSANPPEGHVEGQGYEGRTLGPERGTERMDPDADD